MGILTTAAAFAAGYVTGARKGFGPLDGVLGRPAATVPAGHPQASPAGSAGPAVVSNDLREVRQLMTAAPQTVPPAATIAEAAELMREHDIGDVVVIEDGTDRVIGIVTDRDVAVRGVGGGHDPGTTSVRTICSTALATVRPDETVTEAARLMRRHDVRRLPVVESGVAIGVISLGDIAGSEESVTVLDDLSAAPPNA